jgi:hypothetical protein
MLQATVIIDDAIAQQNSQFGIGLQTVGAQSVKQGNIAAVNTGLL